MNKIRFSKKKLKSTGIILLWFGMSCVLGLAMIISAAFLYLSPKLPDAESYRQVRLENPLRIYTSDGFLIAEFGDKQRDPVRYEEIPQDLINALIASEDKRFYNHNGVDPRGLARSVAGIITGNDSSGGGSTLTMQLAKQISFAGEDPYSRKFKEILLALQIERELSKQEIIELYLNLSFFGISAYGISAASWQYYDRPLSELSLAEKAVMIGILPSPNRYNPTRSRELAEERRSHVLTRMLDQGMISEAQFSEAESSPLTASRFGRISEVAAPYVAEMVRLEMVRQFGDAAMTDGFAVYTTISSYMQATAELALKAGLENYDRKHGYRGPENRLLPPPEEAEERWLNLLAELPNVGGQQPAFVTAVEEQSFTALLRNGSSIEVSWEGMRWAKRFININTWTSSPKTAADVAETGDLVRVYRNEAGIWMLGQIPQANAGMVALDPNNGQIRALVGGYDYFDGEAGKFNRVTQAKRQPGSNFKPFLYTAALANGYSAASLINDAPLARSDYRPENFNGQFMGPIRLKYALTTSKNVVSVRLYDALGANVVLPYITRFGFDTSVFPDNDLSVAIGSQALTPLEIATGYAVFANGGYKVEPHFIQRIENFNDGVIFEANYPLVCDACFAPVDEPEQADSSAEEAQTAMLADQELVSLAEENGTPAESVTQAAEASETLMNAEAEDSAEVIEAPELIPAPRVVDARNAYIMNSILRSVITNGSGRPANRAIDRNDLHGKTGTTNESADLWFSGFNGNLVASVYVGFDTPSSLGRDEQASTVALPIWIDFMKEVLQGTPEKTMAQPDGLVTVRINPETGMRARPGETGSIFEVFREENVPPYGASRAEDEQQIFSPETNPRNIFN